MPRKAPIPKQLIPRRPAHAPYITPPRPATPPHLLNCKESRCRRAILPCVMTLPRQEASPGPILLHCLTSQKRKENEAPKRRKSYSFSFLPHGVSLTVALKLPLVFNPYGKKGGRLMPSLRNLDKESERDREDFKCEFKEFGVLYCKWQ